MNAISVNKGSNEPNKYPGGTVIFTEGKPSKFLYLVKKGEVRLVKVKGQSVNVIQICKEREILNEVSILTNKPNDFSAIALTDVELVLVDHKDVALVMKNAPSWISEIFKTLCDRLKSTQDMIEEHNLASEKSADLMIGKDEEKKILQLLAAFNAKP